ncbi:MAG: cytochrome c oxidase assembly protein [Acidimicrobiales bacterium]
MILAALRSPPVRVGQLFGAWQFRDPYADVAFAVQVLAVAAYLWCVLRLRARDRTWSKRRSISFLFGILVLDIALVSGLASYDDQNFSVHVIQHLTIMMVAPPLLAFGAPITLAIQAAGRRLQVRIIRILHSSIFRALTTLVVAAALYYGSMYIDFLTPLYRYSLGHDVVHNLTHVLMFTFGCLLWWPMVGGADRLANQPSFRARYVVMGVGTVLEVVLGAVLIARSSTIAPEHTLSDTHAGGAVFLIASLLISVVATGIMLNQSAQQRRKRLERGLGTEPHSTAGVGDPALS